MPGMRSLPLAEVKHLLDALPAKYAALLAIGITTGCRISEVLALRRFDLLKNDGTMKEEISFIVLKKKPKKYKKSKQNVLNVPPKNKHRKLSIPTDFHCYILRHLKMEEQRGFERPDDYVFRGKSGKHLSRQSAYRTFLRQLGSGYGTHFMRKTFAQEIFRFFLNENIRDPMRALELTRQALDHARLDTTVKYLGITSNAIRNAQEAIFNMKEMR